MEDFQRKNKGTNFIGKFSLLGVWNKGNLHSFPKERLNLLHKTQKKKHPRKLKGKIPTTFSQPYNHETFVSWAHVTFLFSCDPNTPKFLFLCFQILQFSTFCSTLFLCFFLFLRFAFLHSKQALNFVKLRISVKFLPTQFLATFLFLCPDSSNCSCLHTCCTASLPSEEPLIVDQPSA